MTPVLDQATKARQKSIQLKSIEFAQELSNQLLSHANSMENLYAQLSEAATAKKPKEDSFFEALFEEIDGKFHWFSTAEDRGFYTQSKSMLPEFQTKLSNLSYLLYILIFTFLEISALPALTAAFARSLPTGCWSRWSQAKGRRADLQQVRGNKRNMILLMGAPLKQLKLSFTWGVLYRSPLR